MATRFIEWIKAIGPYAVLVLFVPGGIVLAFLLYLQRRKARMAQPPGEVNTSGMTGAAPLGSILAANP